MKRRQWQDWLATHSAKCTRETSFDDWLGAALSGMVRFGLARRYAAGRVDWGGALVGAIQADAPRTGALEPRPQCLLTGPSTTDYASAKPVALAKPVAPCRLVYLKSGAKLTHPAERHEHNRLSRSFALPCYIDMKSA